MDFKGFTDSETFTPLPDTFFRKLMSEIDDVDELKVTLYALWRIERMETRLRLLRQDDFKVCVPQPEIALEKAVQRGCLLEVSQYGQVYYFLNTPRGRAAVDSFHKGTLGLDALAVPSAPPLERPNIFKLYEENISPLTPLIADALKDAEQTYPAEWIEEAIREAVARNKRNWKYAEAILRRWKETGHAKKQDNETAVESSERYTKSEFEEYLKRD